MYIPYKGYLPLSPHHFFQLNAFIFLSLSCTFKYNSKNILYLYLIINSFEDNIRLKSVIFEDFRKYKAQYLFVQSRISQIVLSF